MGLHWKKALAGALTAAMVLQAGLLGMAAEETEVQELWELTAQELETEEGSAASAYMTIGDHLYYGDYEIGRTDVPATAAYFYITTKDEEGNVINDNRFAYCVQSYFLTPLGGDYTEEMTDNVASIGGEKHLQKVVYYGYGGAGYDQAEFEAFLKETDAEYYETVYSTFDEEEKNELSYVLTHGAASYAYYKDGTSFATYLELQMQVRYGDDWKPVYNAYVSEDVERSGITDGDLDLFAATYGMNYRGITLAKAWYELLVSKKDPALGVVEEDHVYTFQGNEKNKRLELTFEVPEDFTCTIQRENGETETAEAGSDVVLYPAETFTFTYLDEMTTTEEGGLAEASAAVEGTLSGTENEEWNLLLLETNKGTNVTVSKRQQDIAATTAVNMGRTDTAFDIKLETGSIRVKLTDDEGNGIADASFAVYYDEACTDAVQLDGADAVIVTDSQGEAYLEFVLNEKLQENEGRLYVKATELPEGYIGTEAVYAAAVDGKLEFTFGRETMELSGTVEWQVPEGTELPAEVTLNLYQDDVLFDTKTVTAEDDWAYAWTDLPKYHTDENGKAVEYEYHVEMAPVEGFETIEGEAGMVNTIVGETSLTGQISWQDDEEETRPESLTVNLYQDGELLDSVEVSGENDWTYEFEGLNQYSEDGSQEYDYTVDVEAPEGYDVELKDGEIVVTRQAPETETETETETASETETETETETASETETETVTETETETVTETETETMTETEAAQEAGMQGVIFWIVLFVLMILIIFLVLKSTRKKHN